MTIDTTPSAPHECPNCGEPAYLGFGVPAECTNRLCPFWSQDCWVKHVMEIPDEEEGVEFEIEDEDTQPYLNMPKLADLSLNKGLGSWLPAPKHPLLTPGQKKALKIMEDALYRDPGHRIVDWLEEKDLDND